MRRGWARPTPCWRPPGGPSPRDARSLIGYVEPHGRPETSALLEGLEVIPTRPVEYRGVTLREFDVDAALARHPNLILVDELAHTNAEGCRHAKRWQDVEELLEAGINVWTTLNVQHIDSLNDVIGSVTGVTVRETVPDRVFEQANDLELVDITPEELIGRLQAGKVYIPEQAERALGSFFQKTNLVALREFSLRQAARRVQTDVESARRQQSISCLMGDGGSAPGLRRPQPVHGTGDPHRQANGPRARRSLDGGGGREDGDDRQPDHPGSDGGSLPRGRAAGCRGRDASRARMSPPPCSITRDPATSPRSSSARPSNPAGGVSCSARSWTTFSNAAETSTSTSSGERASPPGGLMLKA